MAKNITELTERTETTDNDLIHVNTGGALQDYKQKKINFLKGSLRVEFSNADSILDQASALPDGTYHGKLTNATTATTKTPGNASYYVFINKSTSNYILVELIQYTEYTRRYIKKKYNGTWWTNWVDENGWVDFENTTSVITQSDALPAPGAYRGKINSINHQADSGVPRNNSFYVYVTCYSASYKKVEVEDVDLGLKYYKYKINGTWDTNWRCDMAVFGTVGSNSSLDINIAGNTTAILFILGTADARNGAWNIYCNSSGEVFISKISSASGTISVASSANNKFTITNTNASTYVVRPRLLVFEGAVY